ncbi:MAG: NAD(P)-dependent oxidoreductase, partial [Verrucomicrobiae bacterium]|nr:NAD(P)-dependent oxidoreductase [Verrucomicrobiae bacterium]
STPRVGVCAIAKRDLPVDFRVDKAIGSFDFRGEAVEIAAEPDHVPIGLLGGARIRRRLRPGQPITLDDVELADTMATDIWFRILDQVKVKVA